MEVLENVARADTKLQDAGSLSDRLGLHCLVTRGKSMKEDCGWIEERSRILSASSCSFACFVCDLSKVEARQRQPLT